jgi:hypothetical protein
MIKRILLSLMIAFTTWSFAAPVTPPNGGTGSSNCPSCIITATSAINLPADINLQNSYNNSVLKQIVFPSGQGIVFKNSTDDNQFIISDFGSFGFNDFSVSKDGSSGVSIYGTQDPISTIFQVKSSALGSNPFPYMTTAQSNLIDLTNAKPGWGEFDTDKKTIDFYDGSEKQDVLTAQHITGSGTVTVTNNGDGTVNVFGAGSSTPDGAYSSFSTQNNSSSTVFPAINTFKPVYLGASLSADNSTDFSNSFLTIDSVSTPVMTYTGSTTQEFNVHESFSIRGAVATTATYKFCIAKRTLSGVVTVTSYCIPVTLSDLVNFIPGPKLVGNVQLAQGDSVFAEVQNITNANGFYAAFSNFSATSISGSASLTLQNAYDNAPGYPAAAIQLADGPTADFRVLTEDGAYAFSASNTGVYSQRGFYFNGAEGYFRVGKDVFNNDAILDIECYDDGGCGSLPFPSGTVNVIPTSGLTAGQGQYNSTLKMLQLWNGSQFSNFPSTDLFSGDFTVDPSGVGTIANNVISTAKIANNAVDLTTKITGVIPNVNLTPNTLSATQVLATDGSTRLSSAGFAPSSVILSTGSYADPSWFTSLNASKLTGTIPTAVLANIPKMTLQSFTTAGSFTYTTPAGVTHICIVGKGAGGGSGGVAGTSGQSAASPGGAGGAGFYKCVSSPSSSYAVVIGAGGTAGASGNNAGGTGGTTTFGTSFLSAPGGNGGTGAASSLTAIFTQGAGVTNATGGDINAPGSSGGPGITIGTGAAQAKAGEGGAAALGGTTLRGTTGNQPGSAGVACGSGASGAASTDGASRAGAVGKDGCVYVWEYYNG